MVFLFDVLFILLIVGMAIFFGTTRHREDDKEEVRKLKEEVRQLREEQEKLKREKEN
ncbi:hypothetical protein [Planococcus salinus]|uniref:hypothetical protein n=1 Tax=Planococcus salinus TaxID=1848460 RepID=UPI001314A715|nr:hypothetical protein [Planococcus salinus]